MDKHPAERTRIIPQPPAATRNQPQSSEESFWELLPVMRLLKLTEMRDVSLEEIQRAGALWARERWRAHLPQDRRASIANSRGLAVSGRVNLVVSWAGPLDGPRPTGQKRSQQIKRRPDGPP
jgi:hypothetical protein